LYVAIQGNNIQYPGPHYDEVIFVNAALGGIDDSFITQRITNVPVMLYFYAGALKAYIYFPIFSLFGVSPLTIRLPMIILTAISLVILFFAVRAGFNNFIAWIAFLLLVTSPNLAAHTRMDNGPVAIEFFMRAVCLLALFKAYRDNSRFQLLLLYCFFCIGIFNNVKFIWFINSIYLAIPVLYADIIVEEAKRRNKRFFIKYLFAAIVSYLPFIFYSYLIFQQVESTNFYRFSFHNIILGTNKKFISLAATITGEGVYRFILGPLDSGAGNIYLSLTIAVFAAGILLMFKKRYDHFVLTKKIFCLITILLVTLIQIFITSRADKLWHLFTIQPVFTILISISIYAIWQINWRYCKVVVAGILIFISFYNAQLIFKYQQGYKDKKSTPFWSEAIYTLINYTKQNSGRYFSADWSIHNQLIAFNQDAYRFQEVWEYLKGYNLNAESGKEFYKKYLRQFRDKHYFILHAEGAELNYHARSNLFKIAETFNIKLYEHKRIRDESDNKDIFIIYGIL